MIRVGLIIDLFEGRKRWYFEIFSLLLGCGFIGFFAYYAVQMNWQSWQFNDMSQGVVIVPMWIPQLGYSVGLVILLIALIDELIHVLMGGEPRYEKPKPKTAEEAVEQAIQSAV
jgi:TRAP-type C4-dicarboxylate transport system permease small subunit